MSRPFQIPQLHGVSRNIHIFDGHGAYLGGNLSGGYQNDPPQLTTAMFCEMCDHFLRFESRRTSWYLYALGNDNTIGERVSRDNAYLRPGKYAVLSRSGRPLGVHVTDEQPIRRVLTPQPPSSRLRANQAHFRDTLQRRDGGCVITGRRGSPEEPWLGMIAAHIYPVSRLTSWNQNGYSRWVTDTTDPRLIAPNGLFSAQNGLLLDSTTHSFFDRFKVAHGHKVVVFTRDSQQVGGRVLSPTTRPSRDRNLTVSDDLLRWHFHQAILTNMKGSGERQWDLDYAGGDPMNIILAHEDAGDIMEAELATRLGAYAGETVPAE
ncbi:hypothetical protein BO78DRAFT_415302 [Aspergillus sclerotiicarbonarius CBS 121057]|uniref:HNH nuclease domain-containing protein n=1 Tax=Aspergillus sclerotiicarbonarius (strain CBS 121057 / IBT 28362) TaxID=1448318 RepID=A0A319EHE1_ASPSB|nr:hypothetical protein BO78DRAFT_415302 [Aspergillus sclerotiicarbonarius CBS 121057]